MVKNLHANLILTKVNTSNRKYLQGLANGPKFSTCFCLPFCLARALKSEVREQVNKSSKTFWHGPFQQ